MAELWYNTSRHAAIGMLPFKALYNQNLPSIHYQSPDVTSPGKQMIKDRSQVQHLLKDNLLRAQERMVCTPNKKISDRQFTVGDKVFLKLRPYRQSSIVIRKNHKLTAKFFGPYKVV